VLRRVLRRATIYFKFSFISVLHRALRRATIHLNFRLFNVLHRALRRATIHLKFSLFKVWRRATFCFKFSLCDVRLKGKCALGPFLSILVIECQCKCFCVDLCNVVDKSCQKEKNNWKCLGPSSQDSAKSGSTGLSGVHRTVSGAPGWLVRTRCSRDFIGGVRL
jgi:hypothetical protein